jgi:hypothetical protein
VGTAISPLSGKEKRPRPLCFWKNITDRCDLSPTKDGERLARTGTRIPKKVLVS